MQRIRCLVLAPLAAVVVLVAVPAEAQNKGAPPGPARSSSQFTLRREAAGGADANVARQRARGGDCAGALPSFDAAINVTIEPTLRRDRGLCHEKLGHPFPAIEDYRAYLTARPEAPDADQIRQRLSALEEQAGVGGPSAKSDKSDSEPVEGEANAKLAIGGGGVAGTSSGSSSKGGSSKNEPIGPKQGEAERGYDYYAAQERAADSAESSSLRNGSGPVIGIFTHIPRFFIGDEAPEDFGYGVGGTLRYSTGASLSLVSEFGFAGYGTQGAASSASGPLLFGGAELRLPVSRYASDAVLIRGGLGFERYTISGSRGGFNSWSGRFALGFRHVFGPAVGLEALIDGGPAYIAPDNVDGRMFGLISGSVAFVVGF